MHQLFGWEICENTWGKFAFRYGHFQWEKYLRIISRREENDNQGRCVKSRRDGNRFMHLVK